MTDQFLAWIVPVQGGGGGGGSGNPPGIWGPGDPRPTPPIHLGPGGGIGGPPGIWGGGNVPMPSPPIYIPIKPPADSGLHPEHPIYIPVHIWGGGGVPMPSPPIYLPPEMTFAQWTKLVQFLQGNLPTDPSEEVEPVSEKSV